MKWRAGSSTGRGPVPGPVGREAGTALPPADAIPSVVVPSVVARHPRAIVTQASVELDGRMVRFSSVGRGQPVVLLPDRGDTARAWQAVIQALSETHLLISVALPEDVDASSGQEPAARRAALLAGLLRSLDQPPVSMIGRGLGAVVALRFAEYFPALARRLVLIDAAVVPGEPEEGPSGVPVLRLAPEPSAGDDVMSLARLAVVQRFLEP